MKPGTKEQAAIFRLDRDDDYLRWREEKLSNAPLSADRLFVEIKDMNSPDEAETDKIIALCRQTNMALYACNRTCDDEALVRAGTQSFNAHFGLHRFEDHRSMTPDGLVSIEVVNNSHEGRAGFIPYTNKPISWHTDGYYNPTARRIKAMTLHCVRPAREGGVNELFDPEIAYIRLRDENPDFIRALSHRRALTIPAFVEKDGTTRPQSVGPVFTWDRYTGNLHMRFTDRKRNIEWADNETIREAVAFLRNVLATDELVLKYKMEAGQGIICNNVLHNRSAFQDDSSKDKGRLLMRARYLDRIEGTC